MKPIVWLVALAFAFAFGTAAPVQAEDKPAPEQKAAAPEEIAKLIRDLGDDSFDVRESATKKLGEIGKPALPALREALKSGDVEVRNRAAQAIEKIEPAPKGPPPPRAPERQLVLPGQGGMQFRFQVGGPNVAKEVMIQENGRTVRIKENGEGIQVTVTEKDANGKEATKEFKGKDADDLKKNAPEGFELYQKYAGGIQMMPRLLPGAPGARLPRFNNDPMQERLRKMMEEALEAARNGGLPQRPGAPNGNGPNGPNGGGGNWGPRPGQLDALQKLMEEALKLHQGNDGVDDLRKRMEELQKLLGDDLPALPGLNGPAVPGKPDGARLGVQAAELDEVVKNQLGVKGGAGIQRVLPGSRADKMGVKEFDILRKVNGREVNGPKELREAIEAEGAKKLTLEGLRAGKPLKLEEKE